jgi:4-hydroxy-tetrahydrodipicolinate synthase
MDIYKFRGVTVAHVTPFNTNGEIDEVSLKNLIDRQIENGTNAILTCGTTGESVTLSPQERMRVTEIAIKQSNGRVPIVCGAGTNNTADAVSLTKMAEEVGADAILSVAPYYNKPTQEGFYQHFKAIANSTKLPVIIYNVPSRTGSNVSAETTLRLAEIENIIGTKEASGNFSQIMAILRDRPDDFLVLSGDDATTLPLISLGADGVIAVVANEAPGLFSKMVKLALDGEFDEARQIHYKLLPLMEGNFIETSPIPVKTILAHMGLITEKFRLPLVPITEKNRNVLISIIEELGIK